MSRGVKADVESAAATLDGRGEAQGAGGGATGRAERQRGVPPPSARARAVLSVGEAGPARRSGGTARRPAWPQGDRSHGAVPGRAHPAAGDRRRVEHREPATEKGTLAVRPQRRYRPGGEGGKVETGDQT